MNNESETKRLADAVASIASTIAEIINTRLKKAVDGGCAADSWSRQRGEPPTAIDRWQTQKEMAEHLKVSRRTLSNRMKKGLLADVRNGRS